MTDFRKFNGGGSASSRTFHEFTMELSATMIQKYASSYATHDNMRNRWRAEIPYSPQIENEIYLAARTFIRTLPSESSNSTNLQFLNSLTTQMSDYLSAYTMRSPRFKNRRAARNHLKDVIFYQWSFIDGIRESQKKNRIADKKYGARRKKIQQNHINRAVSKYDQFIERQVQQAFAAAQNTPRNGR